MDVELKPGTRLRSTVCAAEVVVVKAPSGPVDLRCGGVPMVGADADTPGGDVTAPFDEGLVVGKRYTNAAEDIELLCTKAGDGSLSVGEDPLFQKGAKPLPASD